MILHRFRFGMATKGRNGPRCPERRAARGGDLVPAFQHHGRRPDAQSRPARDQAGSRTFEMRETTVAPQPSPLGSATGKTSRKVVVPSALR